MKFDNYMDPRKTFGKAVTQEAEKNEDIVVPVSYTHLQGQVPFISRT